MKKKFTSILFIWVIVSTCTFTIAYGAPNHKDGLQKILGLSRNKRDKYEIENSSSVVEDTLSSSGSGESSQNSESQDKSGDDTAESSDSSSPELPSDAIEIILRCLEKILSISPDGAIEFDSLVQINAPIPCNPSSGKDCVLTSSINNDIMLQSVLPAIRAINDVLPGTNIDPGLILNNDSLSKVLPRYRNMLVMALYPLNYLAKHANLFDFVTNTTSNASTESRASAKPGSDEDTKSVTDSSSLSTLSGVNHSGSPWDVLVHRSSTPSKTSTVTPSSASTTSSNLASNLPASQIHSSASTPGVTSHSIITQSTSPANVAKNGTASPHNLSRTLLGLNSDMNSSNQSSNSSSSEADSSSMSPEIIDSLCQCA